MKIEWYGGPMFTLVVCFMCAFLAHDEFVKGNLFEFGMLVFAAVINSAAFIMEWIDSGNRKL